MHDMVFINTDGGSRGNPGIAGAGVSISTQFGEELFGIHKPLGIMTNNEAEYEAVLYSLEWLLENQDFSVPKIVWRLDSKLVVEQLSKRWKIKESRLQLKAQECWKRIKQLNIVAEFKHIPRAENSRADELANQAMDLQ